MRSLIFVMGKIRRKFETEFKRQLIAQIEAGQTTLGQAARDHQISRSVIERWRVQYRNNALVDRPSSRERQLEAENEKLRAKVGELVMQMDHICAPKQKPPACAGALAQAAGFSLPADLEAGSTTRGAGAAVTAGDNLDPECIL